MQSTDLGNKESGKIWHRKPSPATRDGIIVNIIHTTSDYLPRVLRFLNVAFDSSGDCLIAGDHQGNIYIFDLSGNRTWEQEHPPSPLNNEHMQFPVLLY